MKSSLTTTNIGLAEKEALKKMARRHEMTQVDFINSCVEYFSKSMVNPRDPIMSPREEMAKLTKRVDQVVRFIRTQEQKKLDPLLNNLMILERRIREYNDDPITKKELITSQNNLNDSFVTGHSNIRNGLMQLAEILKKRIDSEISKNIQLEKRMDYLSDMMQALVELMLKKGISGYRKEDVEHFQKLIKDYADN